MLVPIGQTTQTATGLSAATYWVKVTDKNNCTSPTSVTLAATPALTLSVAVSSDFNGRNISCNGGSDGTITATPGSGTGTYSYNWYSNAAMTISIGQTTATATGLGAGTYYVRVADVNGCQIAGSATLVNPPALALTAAAATTYNGRNISCFGASDGSATASPSGGTGAYTYAWYSNAALTVPIGQTTQTAINLAAGTYWVKVTDANLCTNAASVTLTQPTAVSVTAAAATPYNGRNISCFGASDGSATATPAGGTAPYTYIWYSDAAMTAPIGQTTQTATMLSATTYWVNVLDANLCANSASVTLTQPTAVSVTAAVTSNYNGRNISCNGGSDGSATATPAGGTAPYTYIWYSDAAMLVPIGQTTQTATGLSAATYWVKVTDKNLCETSTSVTITQPTAIIVTTAITSNFNGKDISCNGASNGSALASVTGGTAPYSYEWYSDVTLTSPIGQTTASAIGLSASSYWVKVTDANGCNTSVGVTLTAPPVLTITLDGQTNVLCHGAVTGAINVTAAGGVMPAGGYYYTWTGVDYLGSAFISNLSDLTGLKAGIYNLSVKDANNCSVSLATVTISQTSAVTVTKDLQTNVLCFGGTNGAINVTVAGGAPGYSYIWTGTDYLGIAYTNTVEDISGLKAGTYNLSVTDANTCTVALATVTITQPAALTVTLTGQTNVLCHDAAIGAINVTVTGGVPGYTYAWTGSDYLGIPYTSGIEDPALLKAGTYDLVVKDANNCQVTLSTVTITQPLDLTVILDSQSDALCRDAANGTINVTVAGGVVPVGGYFYNWTGTNYMGAPYSSNLEDLTGLKAGIYNLTVKDANNCTVTLATVTINQPATLVVNKDGQTNNLCHDDASGAINVTVTGGTLAYSYAWSGTDYLGAAYTSTTEDLTGLKAGTYNLIVTDGNLCTIALAAVTITQPPDLTVALTGQTDVQCFSNSTGAINVTVAGGVKIAGSYVFAWSGTDYLGAAYTSTVEDPSGLKAGIYSLVVKDANNCLVSLIPNVTIAQSAVLTPGSIKSDQVICNGFDPDQIIENTPAAGGPVTPYNYQWQVSYSSGGSYLNILGATLKDYTPPAAPVSTLYYRRVVTSGLCTPDYSNEIRVLINPLPKAMLTGGETICPSATSMLNVTMPIGSGPFTIDIENYPGITIAGYVSGTDIPVTPAVTTTYKLLRVRDSNGCEVSGASANLTGSATVIVRDLPVIISSPGNANICEYGTTSFTVEATGTDLIYQWYEKNGAVVTPITDGGVYLGANSKKLSIYGATRDMDGLVYYATITGCATPATSDQATLTVKTPPEIQSHPSDITICINTNTSFSVTASGTAITYQWQVKVGAGVFTNVSDGGFYSGATSSTLSLTNVPGSFNNYIFRLMINGSCPPAVYSNYVVLKVNILPTAGLQPLAKVICENGSATLIGNGSGYSELKWEVSSNSGTTWTPVINDATYGGATTNQLSILNAPVTLSGYQYKLGLIGTCTTIYTNAVSLTVNANPVVSFVADINACGGIPVILNGNPSGGTAPYTQHLWTGDVGPLNNYIIQQPTFNSQISGPYNLTYKVTDSKNCTATGDLKVIVDSPSADFNQDINNGCTPLTVSFTKDMTGITKFWWNFDDLSPKDSLNANPVHIFINANASSIEYRNVKLTVLSAGGCLKTFTSMVTVYPSIDATFTASTNIICSGNPIVFTAMSGASKYFWEYGDGASGYGLNTSSHTYTNFTTAPQVLTVKLITTSFYSCSDEKTFTVTVMPVPIPQFSALPVTQIYNPAGNPVTFTNTTNTGSWTYLWRFGDGGTSADANPSHTYSALGTYSVVLITHNANCSDSVKHAVNVIPIPPVAAFDSIPPGCEPLSLTINNTSLYTDTPGTTFRWDFGDGSTSTAKNPTYTYFDPGTYRVELTVTGPGGTSTHSQVINSYPSPKAYFEVAPAFVFVNDEKVRAFNLSEGDDYWVWEWGDGDTSKVREPFHKYMEAGLYDITLSAYSNNGCYDRFILSPGVTVEPAGEIRFSTVFTPSQDGPVDMDHLPTGGTEIDQFFFPPIRDKVTNYKLQIFNRLGVLIFESHDINRPWNGYYRGSLCQQGVYIWYVEGKYANGMPFKKVGDVTLLH